MTQALNKQNFGAIIQQNSIVLVDFYAEWCGPCQALAPILENISQKFENKAVIAKVNVDKNPELSEAFQIRNIPALFYFKNGKIVEKHVGLQTELNIRTKITELLNIN